MKQNLFDSNKISLDQINICSNQINFKSFFSVYSKIKGGIPNKQPNSYLFFERALKKPITDKNTKI